MTLGNGQPLRADAVVIGSGAGGAPAAALLAEAGLEVLVLEAGARLEAPDFSPLEAQATAALGRMAVTADAGQNLYAGACVGGSTVVNDALCFRTPPEVLEGWRRDHGLGDLDDTGFAPYLDRVWQDIHAEPTRRSHINRNAYRLELGARRLGWAGEAMPRSVRGCARLGRCNFGCPTNAKQSTLVTYVPRAERAGARILPRARAARVLVEAGQVRGVAVEALDPSGRAVVEEFTVRTPIVCLAAGVLESGALLLRSGLGGGAAGRGIQFHSSVHVTARFAEPIHGYYGPTMAFAIAEFSDVNGHAGPGFMIENTAVHPIVTANALPGFGAAHARAMEALPQLARAVVVLRDRARGFAELDDEGGARIHYRLESGDLERLGASLAAAARAYLAAGALEVYLPIEGSAPVRREAELASLGEHRLEPSRLSFLYAVHLFGGAVMGSSRADSVCSVDGACWDARGLFVTDASGLPGNTGVNPQVTVMANALRIAEGIAAGRRPA